MVRAFSFIVCFLFCFSCQDSSQKSSELAVERDDIPCPDCSEQIELNSLKLQGKYLRFINNDTLIFGENRNFSGIKKFTKYMIELDYDKENDFPDKNIVTLYGSSTEYWNWYFKNDTFVMTPLIYNNKEMFYDKTGVKLFFKKIN